MAELPEDLIVEIVLRLPVVSLLRFRCVSKIWRNLIHSPNFVKSHLNLSKKAHSVLFCQFNSRANHFELDSYFDPGFELGRKSWYDCPIYMVYGVIGHCNVLLCCKCQDDRGVILWNPSIRKHFQIPLPPLPILHRYWGFGHDRVSDDYKFVILVYSETDTMVLVYSLESGLWWNDIYDFPYYPVDFKKDGLFVNGALHWIVQPRSDRGSPDLIFAFHLGNLYWSLVPLVDSMGNIFGRLGVLDGCLCTTSYDNGYDVFDFWEMKEYGVMESWTKLATCRDDPRYCMPLEDSDDEDDANELRFVTHGNFILANEFKTDRFMTHVYDWSDELSEPLVYIPSLVCPDCGK